MNTQKLIADLINKKAEVNNRIDLDAYGFGAEDALKAVNYNETTKFLEDIVSDYENGLIEDLDSLVIRVENLLRLN